MPGVIEASSQSWEWDTTNGLANGEEIRLLLFTTSALIVNGEGFLGGEASTNAGVNPQADEIPILVPAIPAPGTVALVGLGACVAVRRRR